MGKYDLPLPAWAVPGAEVWLEPHTYGRVTKFRPATISRVTKTSVFIKVGDSAERRFVEPRRRGYGKNAAELYLREYGQRDGWASRDYLHAKDSKHVADLYAEGVISDALDRAQKAAEDFFASGRVNTIDRRLQADRLVEAVLSWKALVDLQPEAENNG
jgi:hypothetical protein